jgi:peroxiredoxin Q/BCP
LRKFQVAVFAASCDTVADNTRFAKELELDYPILSDPDRTVAQTYGLVSGATGFPRRWTFFIGPNGKIIHIDKAVRAGSHGEDCAAKLAELGVAKAEE